MKLTLQEVEHIADLARLQLSQEEKERYRQQLSDILEYAARLQTLDTSSVAAAAAAGANARSRLRPDESLPGLSTTDALRGAAQVEKNQFRVPPVLE